MREMEKAQDEFPLQFLIQMVNNNLMLNKTCYVICSDGANFLLWDVLPPLKLSGKMILSCLILAWCDTR